MTAHHARRYARLVDKMPGQPPDHSVKSRNRTFPRFPHFDRLGPVHDGVKMTKHAELAVTPRDRFLEAAQKELIEFERREREFSKKDRKERAAELSIPAAGFELYH